MNSASRRLKLFVRVGLLGVCVRFWYNGNGRGLHSRYPAPYVHLALYLQVLKRLFSEFVLPECSSAAGDRAGSGASREDAVDAGLAHLVVAFWVDEEAHVGVEVAGRLADGADV